jgi:peptidyl-dipeptidase Dcp
MIKTPSPAAKSANPFFETWITPDQVPPFGGIAPEHFRPAYDKALADHDAELAAITANPAPPIFDNTIGALELSGRALERVGNAFQLLTGAHSNDALLETERDMSAPIARHWHKIHTNSALFRRIDTVMREADARGLNAEQKRVTERYHTSSAAPARRSTPPANKRSPRSSNGWRSLALPSARTCSPTSRLSRSS